MESYPGVYVEEICGGPPAIKGVSTSTTAFVGSAPSGPVDEPVAIASFAEFEQTFGGLWTESRLGFSVRDFFLNGGNHALVVRVNHADSGQIQEVDLIGAGKETASQGLFALKKADLFNLLVIPPYDQQDNVNGIVLAAAAKLCEDCRAFLLVDPPSEWTNTDLAENGLANLGATSKNAAIFFPRLRMSNPLRNDQMEVFAPSGAVAGVFARTDAQRGVWKAAVGADASLAGNPQPSVAITDSAQDVLNPLGVNCLRTLPTAATVIWGSRTLQGRDGLASEWKYVPIRRLFLFLEESLYRGTQWAVFEPNNEPLWTKLRGSVAAFLDGLFRQGALQGQTPKEAYLVKCGRDTMTQADIDAGRIIVLVGVATLKPAEFVILTITLMKQKP